MFALVNKSSLISALKYTLSPNIRKLSNCCTEEFKNENIKVNCLALGAAQTKMLEEAFPGYKAPVSAEQMANFISNFAITGSKFFNGKILPVSLSTP